jgi:hypothetical protein
MADSNPETPDAKASPEQPPSPHPGEPVVSTDSTPEKSVSSPAKADPGSQPSTPVARLQGEIKDAVELMEYAIAIGSTLDDKIIERIKKAENWLPPSTVWPPDADRTDFEKAYRDLAIFMKPVTIDTLRATDDKYQGARSRFGRLFTNSSDAKLFSKKLWTWVLFTCFFIMVFQTASTAYGVDEETSISWWSTLILFGRPLVPFLYGMLGALTYLLRSAHTYINNRTFDLTRTPEYYNRMLLGFTSGGIILLFVDPKSFGVTDGAIAFIVGYNTDYLFQTIERLAGSIFPKVTVTTAPSGGTGKPGIAKLQISTKELEPGARGNGTVALTAPAPAEGVVVTFSSDQAITVTQPLSVASGTTSATFSFAVAADAGEGAAFITANANGTSNTDTVHILGPLGVADVVLTKRASDFTASVVLTREPSSADAKVEVSLDPAASGKLTTPLVIPKGSKQKDLTANFDPATPPVKFIATLGKSKCEKSF